MIDSGATHHITSDRSSLFNLRPADYIQFGLAGTSHSLKSVEEGDTLVNSLGQKTIITGVRTSLVPITTAFLL